MKVEKRISELGICLPEQGAPKGMFVPVVQTGNLCYLSGQIPVLNGALVYTGKVGGAVSLEEAQEAGRICIQNAVAALQNHLGDLDRVRRIVKLQAFVSSKAGFDQQHIVVNAASQHLFDMFGEAGRHARTAVGANQLPLDSPIEIELIVEVE